MTNTHTDCQCNSNGSSENSIKYKLLELENISEMLKKDLLAVNKEIYECKTLIKLNCKHKYLKHVSNYDSSYNMCQECGLDEYDRYSSNEKLASIAENVFHRNIE